jgi:hypothetical protein
VVQPWDKKASQRSAANYNQSTSQSPWMDAVACLEPDRWCSVASGPKSLLEISNFGPQFLGFYNPVVDSSQNSLETGNYIIHIFVHIINFCYIGLCSGLGAAKLWTSTLAYQQGITIPANEVHQRFHTPTSVVLKNGDQCSASSWITWVDHPTDAHSASYHGGPSG